MLGIVDISKVEVVEDAEFAGGWRCTISFPTGIRWHMAGTEAGARAIAEAIGGALALARHARGR